MSKENKTGLPPDHEDRKIILTELDCNIMVEAAAGAGKTTSMVGRMVELIKNGKCEIDQVAAVTFTKKAAAELGGRFRIKLEEAYREANEKEREPLARALGGIDRCFIGTIHSFCARLIRERPVEAGVDIDFEEIEQEDDLKLRAAAWQKTITELLVDDPKGLLTKIDELALDPEAVEDSFLHFCDYPDVDRWPKPEISPLDFSGVRIQVDSFIETVRSILPDLPTAYGNDSLIPLYRNLETRHSQLDKLGRLERPSSFITFIESFKKTATIVQKIWIAEGKFAKEDAKEELARYQEFYETVVGPFLEEVQQLRYAVLIELMETAAIRYDRIRYEAGKLNFADLLLISARMLKTDVGLRKYFSDRYRRLLVDEFQDTDPIQAEVMMYLTAEDPACDDWRKCSPRPGSLFVVGDPKQSIYRFRRADIETYEKVKAIITDKSRRKNRGRLVELVTNFRSTSEIIESVNKTSKADFDEYDPGSEYCPQYIDLMPWRAPDKSADLGGVYRLSIPDDLAKNKADILDYETNLVADFIAGAIEKGAAISRPEGEKRSSRVAPDDFLIVTRKKSSMTFFAKALQARGVPHEVTGGEALSEIEQVRQLRDLLISLIRPHDPVALLAVLRGDLFGIDDRTLYRFKKADGVFNFNHRIADRGKQTDEAVEKIEAIFEKLTLYSRRLTIMPPGAAIERICEDCGITAAAAAADGGDVQAGGLLKAINALRQSNSWSMRGVCDLLSEIVDGERKYDSISALSEDKPVVRIMNLHKVKGLEAPIVFLADPTGARTNTADVYIDRSESETLGYLQIASRTPFGSRGPVIARPAGWDDYEQTEIRFLDAEEARLRYVAATRAGVMLSVSHRNKNSRQNPWEVLSQNLGEAPELAEPAEKFYPSRDDEQNAAANKPMEIDPDAARKSMRDSFETSMVPNYQVLAAKEFSLSDKSAFGGIDYEADSEEENNVSGAELPEYSENDGGHLWGEIIHRLLELKMKHSAADIMNRAENLLGENELDPSLAAEAVGVVDRVIASDIWRRAQSADICFAEAPFVVKAAGADFASTASDEPTIVRGVIDLIFKEEQGWVIVDYKTDKLARRNPKAVLMKYAPQLKLYAEYFCRATGEKVVETGLYLTATDSYITLTK